VNAPKSVETLANHDRGEFPRLGKPANSGAFADDGYDLKAYLNQ
jgi:hypothetical protein